MKKFINPEIEVLKFRVEDVVYTSGNEDNYEGDLVTELPGGFY